MPTLSRLYPCTLPTAPVSRSFGLRSSYEIDILDTDQRPRNWIDLGTSSDPSSPFITDQCQEQYLHRYYSSSSSILLTINDVLQYLYQYT
jgi:hypothetical protein